MPRSMGHPDYVYTPWSEERRAKMSRVHKARLGIPEGHVRVYGRHIPEDIGKKLAPHAANTARLYGYEAAQAFLDKEQPDWALVEALISENMTINEIAAFTGQEPWFIEKMTSHLRRINRKRIFNDGRE